MKRPKPRPNSEKLSSGNRMRLKAIVKDAFTPKPKKPSLAFRVAKAMTTSSPGVAEKSKKYVESKLRDRGDKTRR